MEKGTGTFMHKLINFSLRRVKYVYIYINVFRYVYIYI